jgi:hypothetical protein
LRSDAESTGDRANEIDVGLFCSFWLCSILGHIMIQHSWL